MKRVSKRDASSVLTALLLTACLIGCKGSSLNPKSDLELRFDAAKQEAVVADRDRSLASIATDSAEEGNYRLTQQALIAISNPKLRDHAAEESAVRLVKAGDRTDANKLAVTIKDPMVRNNTLKRLADNDVGSADPAGNPDSALGSPEPTSGPAKVAH